jgi:hypothetical protein
MRLTLDGKSLLVGAFGGAALVASVAAGVPDIPQGPVVGRFRVEAAGSGTGSVTGYLVDTVTGQVWASHHDSFYDAKIDLTK